MDDGILGVGGGEKNPRVRIQRPHPVRQFLAAHVRHDDIGEQQINVSDVALLFQAQGFDAIGRRQNRVTQPSQQRRRHLPQGGIVLHQQNGFRPARQIRRVQTLDGNLRRRFHLRQINLEGRAPARLAINADVAAALFDDAVTGGQSQTRSLADVLGGKKRLERVRLDFLAHSPAGVRDGQHHVVARFQFRITAHALLVERDVGGFQREFAAVGHGVARVHGQVHDDLFNLSGVRLHHLQAGGGNDVHIHHSPPMRWLNTPSMLAMTWFRSRASGWRNCLRP